MKSFAPVLLILWLAGCAGPMVQMRSEPPDKADACKLLQPNNAACEITVAVKPSSDPAKVCTVGVPDEVAFEGITESNSNWILWRLEPASGFVFRKQIGIEFKDPKANVTDGKIVPHTSDLVYAVKNKGKVKPSDPPQLWYYGIHLERANDGMRCGFDPLIKNQ